MMKHILYSCFLLLGFSLLAQQNEDFSTYRPTYTYEPIKVDSIKKEASILVTKPSLHDNDLVDSMFVKLKKYNSQFVHAQGYRVQLYSGNNMGTSASVEAKVRAFAKDWGYSIYRTYDAPTWKVRIGDFLDKLSAHRLYHKIRKEFYYALIVPDSKVLLKRVP
ncbi:MAG: SPOR domain-containing protein [Cyclobacteriaceae bacterium]